MDADVARRYHSFAAWAAGSSPLYAAWAEGIAGDAELTDRIGRLSEREGQPNLIFAAARWVGCGLDPFPQWREHVLAAWADLVHVAATRRTQTNEAGRCATLLPVLAGVPGPIALLETGAAAGLCLLPDRYAYSYDTPAGGREIAPDTGADGIPLLPCRIDDVTSAPPRMPEVVWRAGIDLSPIDVTDPEAVAWLETLIWPGSMHEERVARLRAAVAVARADPPRIEAGDILDRLEEVAAQSPPDATLVVFHSAVLLYLDAEERRRFADLVDGLGARIGRRVLWLSNETAGTLAEIDDRMPPGLDPTGSFVQTVDGIPVALAGQHGATYEVSPFRL